MDRRAGRRTALCPGTRQAVELFSRLALVCAVTMGITGLLTAEIHLGGREDGWGLITQWVTTGYGALVFAKTVAFALLVCDRLVASADDAPAPGGRATRRPSGGWPWSSC